MFCSACGTVLPRVPPTKCSSCGAQHWNDAKPCAGALVVKGMRILLVRRAHPPWRGFWDIPGGFCESGEHPITTARREVFEETGVQVQIIGFLGMWLDEYPGEDSDAKRTLNIYYHAVPERSVPREADPAEVLEQGFFLAAELPEELAFPGHVPAVLRAWHRALQAGQRETPLFDGDSVAR